MEGRKRVGSSSSLTSELFGSIESNPSSSGIFGSIFAPPTKVLGREMVSSEEGIGKRQDSANEAWNSKIGNPDESSKANDGESESKIPDREMSSIYQDQRVQPCHLSSSIYYGGQDIYAHSQTTQNAGLNTVFKKDGEDDSGSASRGNWWQGSLYY